MIKAALQILADLLSWFLSWWNKKHSPEGENAANRQQIDTEIANKDSEAATRSLNADLDELDRLERKK